MRKLLLFFLIMESASAFADEDRTAKCMEKCAQDVRNKENWIDIDARKLTGIESFRFQLDQCTVSCKTSAKIMEDSKSKQWDPNNPIVQRCFAESGVSDNNISLTNYVTNNCIMRGLSEQRQTAENIPTPTPRPDRAGPELRCDRDILARLEASCTQAREASFQACDEKKIPSINAPSQAEGAHAACQQTAAYNGQVSDALGRYISQCQGAKANCASSCLEFSRAVGTYGSGCSGQLTGSFHSTASAMTDMCSGMGSKLSLAQQQKDASDQARASAERDCQQQVAASGNPSEDTGRGDGSAGGSLPSSRVGSGPQLTGYDTSGRMGSNVGTYSGSETLGEPTDALDSSTGSGPNAKADAIDTSGKIPESSLDSSSGDAMSLASLPTRQTLTEIENADDGKTQKSKQDSLKAAGNSGSEAKGADDSSSGGRFLMMLPARKMGSLGGDSMMDALDRKTASTESGPDLSRFLPSMGGRAGLRFDGHGPHANLFEKVSERYKLLEPSLLHELP